MQFLLALFLGGLAYGNAYLLFGSLPADWVRWAVGDWRPILTLASALFAAGQFALVHWAYPGYIITADQYRSWFKRPILGQDTVILHKGFPQVTGWITVLFLLECAAIDLFKGQPLHEVITLGEFLFKPEKVSAFGHVSMASLTWWSAALPALLAPAVYLLSFYLGRPAFAGRDVQNKTKDGIGFLQ